MEKKVKKITAEISKISKVWWGFRLGLQLLLRRLLQSSRCSVQRLLSCLSESRLAWKRRSLKCVMIATERFIPPAVSPDMAGPRYRTGVDRDVSLCQMYKRFYNVATREGIKSNRCARKKCKNQNRLLKKISMLHAALCSSS